MAARRAAPISTKSSRVADAPAPAALAEEALDGLRGRARPASDHPASGGWGSKLERLGLTTGEVLAASRMLAQKCRALPARAVVDVAFALVESRTFDGRQVAYDLLRTQRAAAASLRPADLGVLGRGMDNWVSVDTFACWVSGIAWREGRIDDARVHRWAKSNDRWWRRAALVSTVPLNARSKGGSGDTARTLAVCELLVEDYDDMVEKGMSWALRELSRRDPAAVRRFLAKHRERLAPRVLREVTSKLETGLKSPRAGAWR